MKTQQRDFQLNKPTTGLALDAKYHRSQQTRWFDTGEEGIHGLPRRLSDGDVVGGPHGQAAEGSEGWEAADGGDCSRAKSPKPRVRDKVGRPQAAGRNAQCDYKQKIRILDVCVPCVLDVCYPGYLCSSVVMPCEDIYWAGIKHSQYPNGIYFIPAKLSKEMVSICYGRESHPSVASAHPIFRD